VLPVACSSPVATAFARRGVRIEAGDGDGNSGRKWSWFGREEKVIESAAEDVEWLL